MKKTFEIFDLTGKTALITGAAGLLGIQHASALLESNATVILTDITETGLASTHKSLLEDFQPGQILTKIMDVSQPDAIRAVSEELCASGRRIDILINNAAIDPKVKANMDLPAAFRLENFPQDQWDLQLSVGLTGAFTCCQVFGTAMVGDGKGGVILNISSDLSVISPDQRLYHKDGIPEDMQPVKPVTYSVIKAGMVGLTRYIATYWADKGVRANALSPGGVFNGQDQDFVKRITSLIPLGRMADIDEYRAAVQFLCSDASAYLNGQNIVMDGGRSVW